MVSGDLGLVVNSAVMVCFCVCRYIDSSCVFASFVSLLLVGVVCVGLAACGGLGCFMLLGLVGCLWAFRGAGLVFCGFDVFGFAVVNRLTVGLGLRGFVI